MVKKMIHSNFTYLNDHLDETGYPVEAIALTYDGCILQTGAVKSLPTFSQIRLKRS